MLVGYTVMSIIVTNKNYVGGAIPRSEDESRRVAPGTPLALVGLFMLAIRQRFGYNALATSVIGGGSVGLPEDNQYVETPDDDSEQLPWVWDNTIRPSNECPPPENPDLVRTKILIDSGFNIHRGTHNYRPAIYVDHGNTIAQKIMVDNRVGNHLPSGLVGYYCLANTEMMIECDAETPGEASILGETVWFFLLATRDIFRKDFGLHDISEPVLGKTFNDNEDKEVWKTPISFGVTSELRWAVRPVSPLVNDIAVFIQKQGVTPDTLYQQIALQTSVRE
jgi:hypothetical protein